MTKIIPPESATMQKQVVYPYMHQTNRFIQVPAGPTSTLRKSYPFWVNSYSVI